MPHGLYACGYTEYKSGPIRLFDYCFAFGKKDILDYKSQGVKEDDIKLSSFPYFSRFLPASPNLYRDYQKALILPLARYTISPASNLYDTRKYIDEVVLLLKQLNLEVIGIKARMKTFFQLLGIKEDYLECNGQKIPLLSGYGSFPETAKKSDLIIGPINTALIEASLLGKDYYAYVPKKVYRGVSCLLTGVYEIVYVAGSIEELQFNIVNRRTYREGCSVNDLVDLFNMKNEEDVYKKFENAICEIIKSNDSETHKLGT